jgi:hypothetical protein
VDLARHADRAIYVLIAVMAVTVALEGVENRPGKALAYVLGAAIALTLAELFANRVGISIRSGRRANEEERREAYREAITGMAVVSIPIAFFVLAVLDAIDLDLAYVLAQWSGFAILALYSYVASRASGAGRLQSLAGAAAMTAIGGALIALNAATK